ncbi:hypothetical protein J4409_00150 [Candidatus Woesearchaeota archaeon]|nr:hypothetical protein [Candidatus Woesearchaeota archaeon]
MPHQCVRCNKLYSDGSEEILKGCECGGKFFFFIKQKHLEEAKEITINLTEEDKKQIEEDVLDIIGIKDDEAPVILDLESIRVLEPGKYELDLVELFKGKPLVYRVEDGKYIIDIVSSFRINKEKE